MSAPAAGASEAFLNPQLRTTIVGSDTATGAILGVVLAARVSPSGGHVVVLDAVPPHVKIFGRGGRLRSAFLTPGGGPGESPGPTAVALLDDRRVLVGDVSRRLTIYDLDGQLLRSIPDAGILPLAAVAACDEWVVYGPRDLDAAEGASWIHRIPADAEDAGAVRSAHVDALASPAIGIGRPYGLVATRGGVLVRHDLGAAPVLLTWECGEGGPQVAPLPDAAAGPRTGRPVRVDGGLAVKGAPGGAVPAGIAESDGATLLGDLAYDGGSPRFLLHSLTEGRLASYPVAGEFVIRDSRPGQGILVGTNDPYPYLFLLPHSAFAAVREDRR